MDSTHTKERILIDNSEETCTDKSFASIGASLFELAVPPDDYFGEISDYCKHVESLSNVQTEQTPERCTAVHLLTCFTLPDIQQLKNIAIVKERAQ